MSVVVLNYTLAIVSEFHAAGTLEAEAEWSVFRPNSSVNSFTRWHRWSESKYHDLPDFEHNHDLTLFDLHVIA